MKKTKMLFSFLFFVLLIKDAQGCPIEGPNMPNNRFWKTGMQINSMFDKDMKNIKGEIESSQCFLTSSFGITRWLCFDGKLGVGEVSFNIKDSQKVDYPANFAGGYGGRILLYDDEKNGINCMLGFHHASVHPDSTKIDGVKHEAILDEWQTSLLVSKKILQFKPYIAGKFSKIYLIRKVDGIRERITPEDDLGLVVGTDFGVNENARFNLESRLFDEYSLTFGFNYTF